MPRLLFYLTTMFRMPNSEYKPANIAEKLYLVPVRVFLGKKYFFLYFRFWRHGNSQSQNVSQKGRIRKLLLFWFSCNWLIRRNFLSCAKYVSVNWCCGGKSTDSVTENDGASIGGSKGSGGGRQGRAPPRDPNSFIFKRFLAKICKITGLAHPLWELAPPSGKNLDPPLSISTLASCLCSNFFI